MKLSEAMVAIEARCAGLGLRYRDLAPGCFVDLQDAPMSGRSAWSEVLKFHDSRADEMLDAMIATGDADAFHAEAMAMIEEFEKFRVRESFTSLLARHDGEVQG